MTDIDQVLDQLNHFIKATPETSTGGWEDGEACDPFHRIDLELLKVSPY